MFSIIFMAAFELPCYTLIHLNVSLPNSDRVYINPKHY